ncbi:MAG: hypothetical protein FJW37_15700, partial [Acidobacteria bacterium]|nr:hypothetical protein [Acidobacteriota bacterium]
MIAPLGRQFPTGPGPFGLAVSPDGNTVVTANGGPDRFSLTVLERERRGAWSVRHLVAPTGPGEVLIEDDWRSVFMGLAFFDKRSVFASEGNSGRVRLLDLASGRSKRILNLNQAGFEDSYSGDLALDSERGVLYVLD